LTQAKDIIIVLDEETGKRNDNLKALLTMLEEKLKS